jgi:lysozyme family protein
VSEQERFKKALDFTAAREGGKSDDPRDDGGRTKWGIIQRTYDAWRRKKGLPLRDVFLMTNAEAEMLYFEDYWRLGKCDKLPRPLDLAHFDACVNPGPGGAGMLLQACLNVTIDGGIGPQTLGAVTKRDPAELAEAVVQARIGYYVNEVLNDPKDKAFLRGWVNRCHLLLGAVRLDALRG